jgi:hypothetical protein
MGGDCSPVTPGSRTPKRKRNSVLAGKGKNLLNLFLRLRLENEVGTAVEQEVADEGRKVYVEIMAVVFELIRPIQGLQVRVFPEKCFDLLEPIGSFFVYHGASFLQCMYLRSSDNKTPSVGHPLYLEGDPEGLI